MRPKFVAGLVFTMTLSIASLHGQTKTTEALQKQNQDVFSAFFYNNTLRMLNQKDDKDFDALIKDIEKMKFLMVPKSASFGAAQYKKLVANYKAESFEEIMTSRYQGRNFDIFLKEQSGKTQGMVVTVNDSTNLFVLDIVGSIALDKVSSLFKQVNESTDVAKMIRDFTKKD